MKAAIIILIILTVGLGATLFYVHDKSVKTKQADETRIVNLSNLVSVTKGKLDEQEQVAMQLEKNLSQRLKDLMETSNQWVKVSTDLDQERKNSAAAAEAAKLEIAKKQKQIDDLEAQRTDLTKKMDGLTLNIDNLSKQIADTEKKLAASEGDREFLLKELKRLQAEKAELERQFNDLNVLRTQVAKLKDELSVARRLEWIRMGIYGSQEKKGAEILMTTMSPSSRPNVDLNVILKTDGTASVTNSTPKAPQPK